MLRTYALLALIGTASVLGGCSNGLPAVADTSSSFSSFSSFSGTKEAAPSTLDGRTYHLSVTAERGGAPERLDVTFARGLLDASDAHTLGYAPAPYGSCLHPSPSSNVAIEFEAESRSPSAVRRFKGRVIGSRIEGTLMLAPHGAAPTFFSFGGEST